MLPGTSTKIDQNKARPITLSERWKNCQDEVLYLVYEDSKFIVYVDHDLDVQWETTDEFDQTFEQKDEKSRGQHYNVLSQAALVESLPSEGLSCRHQLQFKRLICEAIICGFGGQYDNALSALAYAKEYHNDRAKEISRYWYLSSSICFSLPFAVIGAALSIWRAPATTLLGVESFWLTMAICSGALGALLSVMSRTGNLAFSSSSGLRLHRLEALSRISVGAMSGAVMDLAILSKLFLFPLSAGGEKHIVMVLAAFAAGASERLVPSIIAQFERKSSPPGPASHDQAAASKDEHQSSTAAKSSAGSPPARSARP